jgi:TonB-linked SusC/RagA family outer membrane protein
VSLISLNILAQNIRVKGVVLDENKEPLIGASVKIVGTHKGTITDLDGKFKLKVPQGSRLLISFVGYKSQKVKVHNGKRLRILMQADSEMLSDVVVIGYGSMKRSDLTGSISQVDSKAIEGYKSSSVVDALGGQLAGVQVTSADGAPGSGFNIQIRGVGTVTGDASPLYVVDGFEVDNIDYLSNNDIASLQVLKDASASAIYGARAANGVVLITTKSGHEGKPIVSYSGSASYRKISKTLEMLTPKEFVALQMELNPSKYESTYYKEGNDEDGVPYKYQSLADYNNLPGIDWQSQTFNPTWSFDHNVSLSGGSKSTKYATSFSHYEEDGIFTNSSFKKNTGKFKINQKITKKITFDGTLYYGNSTKLGSGTSEGTGRFNALAQVLSARPTGGLRLSDEELLNSAIDPLVLESSESLAQVNPIIQAESVHNKYFKETWRMSGSLNIKLLKNLTFKTSGSYSVNTYRRDKFYKNGSKEAYRNGQKPYGESTMGRKVGKVFNNILTYKGKKKKHSYDIMIAQEYKTDQSEYLQGQAKDFPFDNLGNDNLGIGATPSKVGSEFYERTMLSFFTRMSYNYDNRYLLNATLRADGSTVFSSNNKWGIFPSFSAAWRINEEAFMKRYKAISNLKLRLGWGTVGNDRIRNYLSLGLYSQSRYGQGHNSLTVLTPSQLRNMNLKWEGSTTFNVGFDLGLFNNRLSLTADFFVKNTKDLLLAQSLAHVTGFDSQYQNIGKIRNQGLELSLNTVNFQSKNFSWRTNFNITFIKNELVGLQSGVNAMYARSGFNYQFTDNDYVAKVGESLGLIYGYEFDGVYQAEDFYLTPSGQRMLKPGITKNLRYNDELAPGVVKYKDQNNDGEITTADRTVIGCGLPDWFGGITNNIRYKDFDLSFMFQFNYGNDILNATRLYSTQSQSERINLLSEVSDRWTPTNTSSRVPSARGYVKNELYSRYVEDGSFLRLKNITLGYSLPEKWARKLSLSKLRAYVSAQNLYCWTKYTGYDPEVNMRGNNPMTPGVDWGAYPKSRVFTFGIDVQF